RRSLVGTPFTWVPRGYSDCEYFAGQSKGAYSASPLYAGTPNRGTGSELGSNSGSMPGLVTEGDLYRLPLATTRRVRRWCVPLADLSRWPSSTRTAYRR